MEDKRNLTMGIRFPASEAISQLTQIMDSINEIKTGFQDAEDSAENFGSRAAESAGTLAREMEDAREETSKAGESLEDLSDSGARVERSAKDARDALEHMGTTAKGEAAEARRQLESAANAAKDFRDEIHETSSAAKRASSSYKDMGTEADSFGSAAARSAGQALKETNSLRAAIKAGFQGAYGYAGKQADQFAKKAKSGFNDIRNAAKHPIQTIKSELSNALEKAGAKIRDAGDDADDTGDDLKQMGKDGDSAGASIKDGIGSAVTSFFALSAAIEVAKAGFEAVKNFGASILEAGTAAEQTGAKFGAVFADDSGVKEWADNFAGAIHRSNTEVQGFLVSNKAMYQEMGITGQAANDLSKITTSLTYDLGSAFSMDDSEALSVVQDYLKGNTAALAEYGIQIDDTILKQTAMSMGLGSNIEALDESAAAQVRMNALLENSTQIQQAAAKKQEGYANGVKSLKGIWTDFLTSAGEKFAPVFTNLTNTILQSWPQIEPALMGIVDLLGSGLAGGIPVITELATSALPPLVQTLGEVFTAAAPLGGVFLDFATTALPPLASAVAPIVSTFATLAETILPPLSRIISSIATTAVPPLVDILTALSENVIAPLMPVVESIANALLPAVSSGLKIVTPLLEAISPVLSGIADILSKVVGFVGKIVEWGAGGLANILDKIAGVFGGGSSAKSAGADIPHNAAGTEDFQGGWTHINERGGEVAYLPSGSTIIPADKSDKILEGSRQNNVSISRPYQPNIVVNVSGGADQGTIDALETKMRQIVRETYQEMQDEDETELAIQLGNA